MAQNIVRLDECKAEESEVTQVAQAGMGSGFDFFFPGFSMMTNVPGTFGKRSDNVRVFFFSKS